MKESVKACVNDEIRAAQVLLIDEEGKNLGKVHIREALNKAQNAGLDLVEVSQGVKGSVCRIMDYGKWKYQHAKKVKKNANSKRPMKEVNFRPTTCDNDLKYRAKQVDKFLKAGSKVKLVVKFKGREQAHMMKTGQALLERFIDLVEGPFAIYDNAKSDGKFIILILTPHEEK